METKCWQNDPQQNAEAGLILQPKRLQKPKQTQIKRLVETINRTLMLNTYVNVCTICVYYIPEEQYLYIKCVM